MTLYAFFFFQKLVFINGLFIYFPFQSQLSLPPLLLVPPSHYPPSTCPPPFLLRKGEASHGYHRALTHQVAVILGKSSTWATQGSPVRGKESKSMQYSQLSCHFRSPTCRIPKTQLHDSSMCTEGLAKSVPFMLSMNPSGPMLVGSVGFSCGVLTLLSPSSVFPNLHLLFGCGSLNQFPSVAG